MNELDLKSISEKLESINLQFAQRSERRIRTIRYLLFALCAVIIVVFVAFAAMQSEYLNWDYNDPELAVAGTILHGVEFLFVRLAPFALIGSIIGIVPHIGSKHRLDIRCNKRKEQEGCVGVFPVADRPLFLR